MRQHFLFRWTPAAIALWLSGLFFAVFGVLDIWLANLASRGTLPHSGVGNTSKITHFMLRGAAENGAIAALCILGWYLMRRRARASLPAGTLAVTLALFITVKRWLHWQLAGTNQLPWAEPLLVWPFLLYVIVYGFRESRACLAA
jgi:hypothetical protein